METANVRVSFAANSTTPAASTGVLYLTTNSPFLLYPWHSTSLFKFTAASGSPVVNLTTFRNVGQPT